MELSYEIIAYIASFTEDAINLKLLNKNICDEIIKEENTEGWKLKYMDTLNKIIKIQPLEYSINWKLEYRRIKKVGYFDGLDCAWNRSLITKSICFMSYKGKIPKEICNIINLENLQIWHCGISEIPIGLNNLINLTSFELNKIINIDNLFIPLHGYGQTKKIKNGFVKLKDLNLSKNKIKVLPIEIGIFINLEFLDMKNNCIEEIPKEIGNLVNLEYLDIRCNKIEKIPDGMGNLIKLDELIMMNNLIKVIPKTIGNLTNLKKLYINTNPIKDCPKN